LAVGLDESPEALLRDVAAWLIRRKNGAPAGTRTQDPLLRRQIFNSLPQQKCAFSEEIIYNGVVRQA
jgi:hypothetical protein